MTGAIKQIWRESLRSGWQAVRTNWPPLLALQGVMLAVLLAYFHLDASRPIFETIMGWKEKGGLFFTMAALALAGGPVSEFFKVAAQNSGRWQKDNTENALFFLCLFGFMGLPMEVFYALQSHWFGTGGDLRTVTSKVLVDQFFYTTLVANPFCCFWTSWRLNGHCFATTTKEFVHFPSFYARRVAPVLASNWFFWFPATFMIYSLPTMLQIPMGIFASALWAILLASIAASTQPTPATTQPQTP